MHYRVEKFKMGHLDIFEARKELEPEIARLRELKDMQKQWESNMPIFTLFCENKPILIYGMFSTMTGTYMPMIYAGKGIDKHIFRVVRCIYDYIEKFVGTDVRRFEAYTGATDKESIRLGKFFGFEIVGYRRQAGVDGSDQVILERLWRK